MTEEELVKKFESENITLASINKRAVAYVIDYFVIAILIILAFGDLFKNVGNDIESITRLSQEITPYITVLMIAYQTFFVCVYGATLGKMAVKIRVISTYDCASPNLISSLTRAVTRIFSEMIFCVGFLWAFKDYKKQTWQDITAKTLVINA